MSTGIQASLNREILYQTRQRGRQPLGNGSQRKRERGVNAGAGGRGPPALPPNSYALGFSGDNAACNPEPVG